jgi:hypothetical protein
MFKNFFDSLFIIDPKEKPAPSFLLAYIFTWLVVQHEVTLAFIKTKGDFTTRFNASLNLTNHMEYGLIHVLGITMVVVLIRFVLNGVIYYMREFIENKTQDLLISNEHKSPVNYSIFYEQQIKISELQTNLLSSQDREKMAKELEQDASSQMSALTINRDKNKAQFEAQVKTNTNISIQLESSISLLDSSVRKEKEGKASIKIHEKALIEKEKLIDKQGRQILHFSDELSRISHLIKTWSKNSGNKELSLLLKPQSDMTDIDNDKLFRLIDSLILNRDMSKSDLNMMLGRIKLGDSIVPVVKAYEALEKQSAKQKPSVL